MDLQKIILTTDFSECAHHAFAPAASIARRHGATVALVNVAGALPPTAFGHTGGGFSLEDYHEVIREKLRGAVIDPVFQGLSIEPVLLEGFGPEAIDAYQRDQGGDLLITATHGHSGLRRLVMGSFAERLVRLLHCPVLTFRGDGKEAEFAPKHIVYAYDFSKLSRAALPYVQDLRERFSAEVTVLHVLNADYHPASMQTASVFGDRLPTYWEKAEDTARQSLDDFVAEHLGGANARVVTGAPGHEIVGQAKELGADLVVVATHGHTGLTHALLGSVAERVVRKAPCSVLTIRPRE